jgi:hypothetical protein
MRKLLLALALAAALPLAAHADVTTRVDGSAPGSATFEGSVTLTGFAAEGDRVVAVGTLSGTLEDGAGEPLAEADGQPLRLAVERGALRASCDLLTARLQAGEVQVGGQGVRLEAIELEIPARAGGAPLRETLCRLAEMLRGQPDAGSLAASLDAALRALG